MELYQSELSRTRNHIVKESPIKVPRQPFVAVAGYVCVRLTFDIDEDGKPINIGIDQSSGFRSFDQAAVSALRNYVFDNNLARNCRMNHVVIMRGKRP